MDWSRIRGVAEAMARRFARAPGRRSEGDNVYQVPLAKWITHGVTRCGRRRYSADFLARFEVATGVIVPDDFGVWYADGSPLQDAVQDAVLTTYRAHLKDSTLSEDVLCIQAARRAKWHMRAWEAAPGRYIPTPESSRSERKTLSAEDHGQELEEKVARVETDPDPEPTHQEVLAVLALLPEKERQTCILALAFVSATGQPACSDAGRRAVNRRHVSDAEDAIRVILADR